MSHTAREAIEIVEHATAVVITVYLGPDADRAHYADLLDDTTRMYVREVSDPKAVCLSVDGPGIGVSVAQEVSERYGTSLVVAERNGGKFAAVQRGVLHMLQEPRHRYFAAVDQDGDHFASDLLNFVRSAEHVRTTTGADRILVMGERASLHRPLGYLRGEQETLADAMLLDALTYDAAVQRPAAQPCVRPIRASLSRLPRRLQTVQPRSAQDVFATPPELAGCTETAYYRHAIEAVMVVEALVRGATLVSLNRRTFDEQPVSVFASFNLTQLTANLILWPCMRLGVPGEFVRQWLDNHLPELRLGTIQPDGRDELLAIRRLVLEGYGLSTDDAHDIVRPRFV